MGETFTERNFYSSAEPVEPKNEALEGFAEKALEKKVDIFKDELVIHGTFIENIKDIFKNGLSDEAEPKRSYENYQQPFSNPYDQASPWEDPQGRGLYFSRINNETAFNLNNCSYYLPNLKELQNGLGIIEQYGGLKNLIKAEKELRGKYAIPQDIDLEATPGYLANVDEEKNPENFEDIIKELLALQKGNLNRQNEKLQKALKYCFKEAKITNLDKIEITNFIDQEGEPQAVTLDVDDKEREVFYDIDGWLKLKNLKLNSFSPENGFVRHYPIHLILNPNFFESHSNFVYSFKHQGDVPVEAINGLMITLDIGKLEDSETEKLGRRTYIPLRNKEAKKAKKIKKDAMIRWLKPQILKIFKENPERALPLYDEKGNIIYP